jgi:uncharacterized tellurite resistance protein B-like protein
MEENGQEKVLKDYTPAERSAYLGAIASIATVDHVANEQEIEYIKALTVAASLSPDDANRVVEIARDPKKFDLKSNLEALKTSELRFALLTDIIAFAKSDGKYSGEESKAIKEMAQHLNVNSVQVDALDQFVDKSPEVVKEDPQQTERTLQNSGFADLFRNASIPSRSITRGLLSMLAPFAISRLLSRRRGGGAGMMAPSSGSLFGGGGGGALSSIFSLLSGNRSYPGMGSVLSRMRR